MPLNFRNHNTPGKHYKLNALKLPHYERQESATLRPLDKHIKYEKFEACEKGRHGECVGNAYLTGRVCGCKCHSQEYDVERQ
jgi:hypothetical protein